MTRLETTVAGAATRDRAAPLAGARHWMIALVLSALTLGVLVATEPQTGLTWDEPAYMAAAESYVAWLGRLVEAPGYALSYAGVQRYWEINHEHPPLDKVWSGLVWTAAGGVTGDLLAHRLGNMLLAAGLVAALYLAVARGFGAWAGVAAAAALVTMPRFFFHAHLAALDVPAAAAFFGLTTLFFHTAGRRSVWWDLLFAGLWGAGLATKINAAFVLPVICLWALLFARRGYLLRRLAVAALLGPLVFVALWPWLYHDTVERIVAYVRFITVDHWEIGQWYLGAWHMPPPWHFSFVMLVAVTPTLLLLCAGLGAARGARSREAREQTVLWSIGALVPLLALAVGQTKVYDNERLFMPAFPFLAALAGVGLAWLGRGAAGLAARAGRPGLGRPAAGVVAAAVFAPHLWASSVLHPHLLSYYSEAVGGLPGAVRLGLEATYWCETYAEALPLINERAPRGATVWAEDWSHDVLHTYQMTGRLRADLRVAWTEGAGSVWAPRGAEGVRADIGDADYVIVAYRQTGLAVHPEIERWRAGRAPILRVERFGVPLLELYER